MNLLYFSVLSQSRTLTLSEDCTETYVLKAQIIPDVVFHNTINNVCLQLVFNDEAQQQNCFKTHCSGKMYCTVSMVTLTSQNPIQKLNGRCFQSIFAQ